MKPLTLLIFLLFPLFVAAQDSTWYTFVNEDGRFEGLIKTQDGNYVGVLRDFPHFPEPETQDSTWLIKFDDDGNILWWKYVYAQDSSAVGVDGIFEDDNGNIILFGGYNHFLLNQGSFYLYEFTANGDSSLLIDVTFNPWEVKKYNQNYWVHDHFQKTLYEINSSGQTIDSISFNDQGYHAIEISDDYLFLKNFTNSTTNTMWKYDLMTNTLVSSYQVGRSDIMGTSYDNNYIYAVGINGLYKYDHNGNELWHASKYDYQSTNLGFTLYTVKGTSDGGCIFGGSFSAPGVQTILVVKYFEDGTLDWYRYMTNTPLVHINHIVEADDGGFVFIGYSNTGNWLVKVDNQGLFINTFEPSSYTEQPKELQLNLFPNPVQDILHIQSKDLLNGQLSIYNNIGQLILDEKIDDSFSTSFSVSMLPTGLYYLRYYDQNKHKLLSKKWIKQ